MSIYFCFFLSCVIHIFMMNALLHHFYNLINESSICAQKYKIITLSLLQSNQIFCESSEKKQLLKTLKTFQKKQNLQSTVCSEKKNLDYFKNKSNSDKISPLVKKNNVNFTESVTHPVPLPKKCHQDKPYVPSCIINRIYPEYPNRAQVLGIEGKVTVQYDVNTKGKIDNIVILSAVPAGMFEENIRSAMRRWAYEHNKPEKNLVITFKFCLNSGKIFRN